MLGSLIVYFKGMRIMMFQLSGYYCRAEGPGCEVLRLLGLGLFSPVRSWADGVWSLPYKGLL